MDKKNTLVYLFKEWKVFSLILAFKGMHFFEEFSFNFCSFQLEIL